MSMTEARDDVSAAVDSLVAAIGAGSFDDHLVRLQDAAQVRLKSVRRTRTVGAFSIGDRVRVAENCGTQYLRGAVGSVVELKVKKVVITLDAPMGRFLRADGSSARITCPTEILDHL